jgi:hypothetical protein
MERKLHKAEKTTATEMTEYKTRGHVDNKTSNKNVF